MEESANGKSERIMKKLNSFKKINKHNLIRKRISSKTIRDDKYFKINSKENNNNYPNINEINKNDKGNIFNDKKIFRRRLTQYNNSKKVRLKLTYELIKSGIKKYNMGFFFNIPTTEERQKNIIDSIKIQSNERTPKDIFNIKQFLIDAKLLGLLKFTNCNEEVIDKLLINCCINCKYHFARKDTILYKKNDLIDNFYIIINGKIGIFKPYIKKEYMTGFDYFRYIYDLYTKNESYLLGLVLRQNYYLFPIKENMLPYFNLNVAHILIQKFKSNKKNYINLFESIEDILKKCFINPINYKYNKKISKNNDFNYELISNITDLNIVYIYEYNLIEEYYDGNFIESISNEKFIKEYNLNLSENIKNKDDKYKVEDKRIFTAKILSDTHLCYFDLNNFYNLLISEYKKIIHRDSKFLSENYFLFKEISKQFEQKYFPLFEYEEIKINQFLFKEDQSFEYIYFIKEGTVELSINKSILQMHELLKELYFIKDRISNPNEENINNKKNIFDINIFEKAYSINEQETKLVVLEKKDIIGLECFYLGINYFYNAKVIRKGGTFYKIKKENFSKILELEEEKTGFQKNYQDECEIKIDFLIDRIFTINKVKLNLIENKKNNQLLNKDNKKNQKILINFTHKNNKMKIIKKINELFEEKFSFENKRKKKKNKFNNTFINYKKYLSHTKNKSKYYKKIFYDYNNQIYSRNQSKVKILKQNNFSQSEKNLNNQNINQYSLQNKKIIDNKSIINISENQDISENNNSSNSMVKIDLPDVTSTSPIQTNRKSSFGLKTEKYLFNKVKKQLTYDNLFLNFSKHNIDINNSLNNIKLIEKSKISKSLIKNNSPKNIDFIPWKYFHYNENIEPLTNRKRTMRNYWYKNIDKLKDNNNDYSSIGNWIYGINNNKNKVKLYKNKDYLKSTNSLL